MKNILTTFDNNVLFMLVINQSRRKSVLFGIDVMSQYDRVWFDNAMVSATFKVDEILLPITRLDSRLTQDEVQFSLSPIGGVQVDRIASLIEAALVALVYKQWCNERCVSYDEEESLLNLKHVVLGVGVKFNRKNEK